MKVLFAVFKDIFLFFNPRSLRGRIGLVVLVVAAVVAYMLLSNGTEAQPVPEQARLVEVATAMQYSGESTITFIGTVAAVNEARLASEASGRVTQVPVRIGQAVGAGQVIARLESQSQYANVLQAEGAYEAALAASAQSDVGVDEAEQALRNAKRSSVITYKNAYNTVDSIRSTNIDQFFSNPDSTSLPGLRIDGGSDTQRINQARIAFGETIADWGLSVSQVDASDDSMVFLNEAQTNTREAIALIDLLLARLNDSEDQSRYTEAELRALISELTTVRGTLNNTVGAIDTAENAIVNAQESLEKAAISGSNSDLSAANAQVKQALGRLRAAQADYQKTVITTPISGEITTLDVKAGDFIGVQSPVGIVTNDNALEITAFVGETEKNVLSVGDEVEIENEFVGRVSAISSAINPTTKKTEIKIQTDDAAFASGDTVRISLQVGSNADEAESDSDTPLVIPITAVKFAATDGFVFVVTDGVLESVPVSLGTIQGNFIAIEDGIDNATEFVVDARGLSAGTPVETRRVD